MDSTVTCPSCGADGTEAANAAIGASASVRATGPRRPAPLPGQANLTQAKHQARAKIMWGDAPAEVAAYLVVQGFPREVAAEIVQEFLQERLASIRGNGLVKLGAGGFLLAIPVVTLVVFLAQGVIYVKTLLATVVVGFVGVWFIIKGAMMVFAPKSEAGGVTDE